MVRGKFHEEFRHEEVSPSSDRLFGIVALWPLAEAGVVRIWVVTLAILLLAIAVVRPALLAPLNRAWTAFGTVLHRITNPVIMGFVFPVAVIPTALIMRALGKDALSPVYRGYPRLYAGYRTPAGLCYLTRLNRRSLLRVCTIAATGIAFRHIGLIHQIKHL